MAKLLFIQKNLFALENLCRMENSKQNNNHINNMDKRKECNGENGPQSCQIEKKRKNDNEISSDSSEKQWPIDDQNLFSLFAIDH